VRIVRQTVLVDVVLLVLPDVVAYVQHVMNAQEIVIVIAHKAVQVDVIELVMIVPMDVHIVVQLLVILVVYYVQAVVKILAAFVVHNVEAAVDALDALVVAMDVVHALVVQTIAQENVVDRANLDVQMIVEHLVEIHVRQHVITHVPGKMLLLR
jgi:hypothetical protein